jgi:hypothetical protein
MLDRLGLNTERGEVGDQIVRGGGHDVGGSQETQGLVTASAAAGNRSRGAHGEAISGCFCSKNAPLMNHFGVSNGPFDQRRA